MSWAKKLWACGDGGGGGVFADKIVGWQSGLVVSSEYE